MNVVIIGSRTSVGKAAQAAFKRDGHVLRDCAWAAVDALVVLPGICPGKALTEYDGVWLEHVMRVNFMNPAKLVRDILPHMVPGGRILLMSSAAAQGSFDALYAASKGAIESFVKSIALWHPNIRINALAPHAIEGSGMFEAMSPERQAHHRAKAPGGRLVTLEEVAEVIVQMACGAAWAQTSGQVITVGGSCASPS